MAAKRKRTAGTATRAKARKVLDILEKAHPDARIYLNFDSPFQLLVMTILAAQCTDERVNQVAPELFGRYATAADIAAARSADIQRIIRPTGFYRRKTKSIQQCSRALAEEYGGQVPPDIDALTEIRGVGRKTANVVLAGAFGQQTIAVDTHVKRVASRLGLAEGNDPDRIEGQLCGIIPQKRWTRATLLLGTHGRRICGARKPDHENCPVSRLCAYYAKDQMR